MIERLYVETMFVEQAFRVKYPPTGGLSHPIERMVLMNTATVSQLPLDSPRFPDVESQALLWVVPSVEPEPVERLATVHRLVTDVLAAEPRRGGCCPATGHCRWTSSFRTRGLPEGLPAAPIPGCGGPWSARFGALPVGWRAHRPGHRHDGGPGGRRSGRAGRPRGPAGRHPLVDRRVDKPGRSRPSGHG